MMKLLAWVVLVLCLLMLAPLVACFVRSTQKRCRWRPGEIWD